MFVILFGSGTTTEWRAILEIFELFCRASGMEINVDKTCVLCVDESHEKTQQILEIFPVKSFPLDLGFKYLDYMFEPNCYQISDWHWLVRMIDKRIKKWAYKYLSFSGRLILVKSVLNTIPIYWLSLALIPRCIIQTIKKCPPCQLFI